MRHKYLKLLIYIKQKQKILEESDLKLRLKKLAKYLSEELKKFEVQSQIRDKVQKEVGKTQREYYLRQQLKAIKNELGESDESIALTKDLEKKLQKKKMPKEAKEKLLKEIKRLESIPSMSPEHSYVRTYVEWMLDVPWSEKTKDVLDLKKAAEATLGYHAFPLAAHDFRVNQDYILPLSYADNNHP